ncbi:MAG: hypothetical protein HY898_25300 [Deltaproteobacteria bacterium]|nr:hypothetical protein [Deltaproteobacteria bacterium]
MTDHLETSPHPDFHPRTIVGTWPVSLWALGAQEGFPPLAHFDGRGWQTVATLERGRTFGGFKMSDWRKGAVLVGETAVDLDHDGRMTGKLRAYGGPDPAPLPTDESGRNVIVQVYELAGFESGHAIVLGTTGPELGGGAGAVFLWDPSQRHPTVRVIPDAAGYYGALFAPSPDDLVVSGYQRMSTSANAAACWRLKADNWQRIDMPPGAVARSYAQQRDGTEWVVIDGDRSRPGPADDDSHLWRREPGRPWQQVVLPTPETARIKLDPMPTAHEVRVWDDDSVWVEASYFEDCDRGMIVSTRQPASLCLMGDKQGCMPPDQEAPVTHLCDWMLTDRKAR